MGNFRSALYGVLTIALGACQDPLVVANSNNPDRGRVFNSAADLEQFIASGYARAHAGTLGAATVLTGGSNDALQPQLLVMGMENVSALANFAMGPRSAIPRNPITNARGSPGHIGNDCDWGVQPRAARPADLRRACTGGRLWAAPCQGPPWARRCVVPPSRDSCRCSLGSPARWCWGCAGSHSACPWRSSRAPTRSPFP